jgi:hypothetical protein
MKDGTPTILYTKETREYLRPALYPQSTQSTQSNRATEQQSNRALCRSRDPCSVRLSSVGHGQLQLRRLTSSSA